MVQNVTPQYENSDNIYVQLYKEINNVCIICIIGYL